MRSETPLLAYFGHHKAASRWIRFIVGEACEQLGLRWIYVHNPRQFDADLKRFVEEKQVDFLIHANSKLEHLTSLSDQVRGFHVIRDPRDVAVSAYFSHLHSHTTDDFPRLVEHREKLRKATKEEGLLLEFEFLGEQHQALSTWDYHMPNVLELRMEEVIQAPHESFERIFAFLGLLDGRPDSWPDGVSLPKLTASQVAEIVERNDFAHKSGGRQPGEEDVQSHYRKGVPGDWRNHFTDKHKDYVKKNLNGLLVKLGYEIDDRW
jgi:hypothetical protein